MKGPNAWEILLDRGMMDGSGHSSARQVDLEG